MIYFGIAVLFALLLNELIDLNRIKVLFYKNANNRIKLKADKIKEERSFLKKFMVIYTFPTIINIFLIASIFNFVDYILIFYGITFPILVLIKFVINNFIRKIVE